MLLLYTCSPEVPVESRCDYECLVEYCVTATLKQAESSRSRQSQATEPGQDGPYQCLGTRPRTGLKPGLKTKIQPGNSRENPDYRPERRRFSNRVGLLFQRPAASPGGGL